VVSKKSGNDISRELSFEKRKLKAKFTNQNAKIWKEYKDSGAEFSMSFPEYKKKWLKENRKKK